MIQIPKSTIHEFKRNTMERNMYIPHEVFSSTIHKKLSSNGKVLLFSLWSCCWEWGDRAKWQLTIKQEEMAVNTNLTRQTIVRVIQELIDAKLIWTCGGLRSTYRLTTTVDCVAHGSLTVGQRLLTSQLRSVKPHPQTPTGSGHVQYLLKLKKQLMDVDCRCYVCGAKNALELHHLTYERYGHERIEDCILLCERCHDVVRKAK